MLNNVPSISLPAVSFGKSKVHSEIVYIEILRSSLSQIFFKVSVLKNVINFTGKHL